MSHDGDRTCPCVSDHRPDPLELNQHHVIPTYLGGPDTEDNKIWICPTVHVDTHEILREFLRLGRVLTLHECSVLWPQPVSRFAHDLAVRGYVGWKSLATRSSATTP